MWPSYWLATMQLRAFLLEVATSLSTSTEQIALPVKLLARFCLQWIVGS
jgi:hypothetical protein